jgi:hypothetical protein
MGKWAPSLFATLGSTLLTSSLKLWIIYEEALSIYGVVFLKAIKLYVYTTTR